METELSRARNKEKEKTILSAAVRIVAADGVGASIARITKEAEISVGSLYAYFASKDALLNALYLSLKAEVAEALLAECPVSGSAKERGRYLWNQYIFWALANPEKQQAMQQLSVSSHIKTAAIKADDGLRGMTPTLQSCLPKRSAMPPEFALGLMQARSGAEFHPERTRTYRHIRQYRFSCILARDIC